MKAYGHVKEEFPDMMDGAIYAPVVQQIYDQMQQGKDTDEIINNARSMMMQGYETREKANNAFENGGVSGLIKGR